MLYIVTINLPKEKSNELREKLNGLGNLIRINVWETLADGFQGLDMCTATHERKPNKVVVIVPKNKPLIQLIHQYYPGVKIFVWDEVRIMRIKRGETVGASDIFTFSPQGTNRLTKRLIFLAEESQKEIMVT